MSLNLTYRNSSCIGWNNPNNINLTPSIVSLSGYYSPAGSTTLLVIFGTNFRNFSRIQFGTYKPNTIFISSEQIQFYVPSSALAGTYPIQVFNDTLASNVVTYTLDNASGYWYLNLATQRIINTNIGGTLVNKPSDSSLFGPSLIALADKNYAAISTQCDVDAWPVYLNFIPQVQTNGQFNAGVKANDSVIMNYRDVSGNYTGINLTFWSNDSTPRGVRISPTETIISGDLTVTGTIYSNNPITPIPSDYRIKENVKVLDESFNVDQLKPIKYYNTRSKNEEIGFLAHEVQEVFPFLVNGEKDGEKIQTLNYTGLIGVLVKEIQDLKAEVKQLKLQMNEQK
jgi:hypothetical protein